MSRVAAVALLAASGAAAEPEARLYASAESRYMLELASHHSRHRGGETNGSNPGANLEAGIVFRTSPASRMRYKFGLTHDSNWREGFPFNRESEDHDTSLFFAVQIGGF